LMRYSKRNECGHAVAFTSMLPRGCAKREVQ